MGRKPRGEYEGGVDPVLKYRQKISGPMLDRMDIQKYVQTVDFMDLSGHKQSRT